jgi:hypothetical protein
MNGWISYTICTVSEGMEDHPSAHTLLKEEKMRVESPLLFSIKLRNYMVRQERIKIGGKSNILIRTLGYF